MNSHINTKYSTVQATYGTCCKNQVPKNKLLASVLICIQNVISMC